MTLLISLFGVGAAMLSAPVIASTNPVPNCIAKVPDQITLVETGSASLDWRCDGSVPKLGPGRIAVRLVPTDDTAAYLETRTGYLHSLSVIAFRGARALAGVTYPASTLKSGTAEVSFAARLPDTNQRADSYIAVFEGAEFPTTIGHAQLVSKPVSERLDAEWQRVTLAMFVGFLLLPVILNLGFFRALRAEFLLWHALLAFSMAAHLMTSGLIAVYWPIDIIAMTDLAISTFGLVVIAAIMFATRLVETDRQSHRLRRLLEYSVISIILITVLRMARIDAFEPYSAKVYFASFLPVLILMVWFVIDAARRGSRAVWFQIIAWVPFLVLALLRIGSMLGTDAGYLEAPWLFRVGTVTEVIFTALGVVDRVMALKRERDIAQAQAYNLIQISEQDSLTGLPNRRMLESRFDDLREQGFDTFALLDLDKFKDINDLFGHQVGDQALIACASAIRGGSDRDTIAVRLGGEEFVVLARGKRSVERVEALRQAIPLRIAGAVKGLDRPVTASMGVVELPRASRGLMTFEDLYSRADQLLYEAKSSGRNRMYFERLSVFEKAPKIRSGMRDKEQAA
ncbi:diguanylate cyclase domain-containing protein [Qipengyuania sp. ASV99]|uniref:GGDEF domain-containing protein n=1 Tax=Qipengyuania sp. ASV99 TaxID=3399681 RepID=UPI003A4C5315